LMKTEHSDLLVIVSAMGKTTNALEAVVNNYFGKSASLHASVQEVRKYHNEILLDLFEESHPVFPEIGKLYGDIDVFLKTNKSTNLNFVYDQIVGFGELLSSTIVANYLNLQGLKTNWLDVRNLIKTDNNYRDANVDWDQTQKLISKNVSKKSVNVT